MGKNRLLGFNSRNPHSAAGGARYAAGREIQPRSSTTTTTTTTPTRSVDRSKLHRQNQIVYSRNTYGPSSTTNLSTPTPVSVAHKPPLKAAIADRTQTDRGPHSAISRDQHRSPPLRPSARSPPPRVLVFSAGLPAGAFSHTTTTHHYAPTPPLKFTTRKNCLYASPGT
ncbi:uncharacterized protein YALI1_F20631g [Yarrowia lipolytica]|uniref:Uncharacterized protein n=1 Tax=Yarrowia lipolytica TaxID=4952 RepID=A0A1D8NNL7_YARLL|nr:hypothetical protein YALI1_F20631g [Yarrowia lipolytica]